jgi:mannose-6-phosphate isomerase
MHGVASLNTPLTFKPVYQSTVWGGRNMETWRKDLPEGPIGESWDLADHSRGMSVVADGPHAGETLRALTSKYGSELIGAGFSGGTFPLMVKLIDARERLSVQVHPDDRLAKELKLGAAGKTECWMMLNSGGELFVGTTPGCTRESFSAAIAAGTVIEKLNRFTAKDGDFFFLPARTVHALGAGCLLYEVQQTCDTTFRVFDWNRVGLDNKPRPLHIEESLTSIDFGYHYRGPVVSNETIHYGGGSVRQLVSCEHFSVEERRARQTAGGDNTICSVVVCLAGAGTLATSAGGVEMKPMRTYLVPAAAGPWTATAAPLSALRLLVAQPAMA